MKLKLRDLLMVSAILFLGFIAYSNFSTLAKNWTSTNCYKNIQYRLVQDGKKGKRFRWKLQFKNNCFKKLKETCTATPAGIWEFKEEMCSLGRRRNSAALQTLEF